MIVPKNKTVVKTNMFELLENNKELFAIRLDDGFISNPLTDNAKILELVKYKGEFTGVEINQLLNEINYFEE